MPGYEVMTTTKHGKLYQHSEMKYTNRRNVYSRSKTIMLIIFALLLATVFIVFDGDRVGVRAESSVQAEQAKVLVYAGDTLWGIASEHAPSETNVRSYINELKALNGLSSSHIIEGQVLLLPQDE